MLLVFLPGTTFGQWVQQPSGGYLVPQPQQVIIQHTPPYTTVPVPWYYPQEESLPRYMERKQAAENYNLQVQGQRIRREFREMNRWCEQHNCK